MARTHVARHRSRRLSPPTLVRRLAKGTITTCLIAACTAAPLLAGTAQADAGASSATARTAVQAVSGPLRLTVTSVSPSFARFGGTVTVSGRVRNVSGSALSGLTVQLWSSTRPLASRIDLVGYAHGTYVPPDPRQVPGVQPAKRHLAAGHSWSWTTRVPVSDLGLTCFGVYPLTAEVGDAAGPEVARDPVPLPYWPAKSGGCATQSRPRPFAISWIWPLIDTPYQGACHGLLGNGLAASIAPGGRLANLLAVGERYSHQAKLTWAVDPALLDNLRTMEKPYPVGASDSCSQAQAEPASANARTWLADLSSATAGQPVFATPYADVDVAALVRHGDPDLGLAFTDGDQIAREVLHRGPAPVSLPSAGGRSLAAVAWPAGGVASPSVLEKLAALRVSTVILTMPGVSPVSYTPGAVTSVLTGIVRYLHILLADHGIAGLLGSPAANSRQTGDLFMVSQLYLAETAQIVAEAPGHPRPMVVTPPRRWDPTRRLAAKLLADTVAAPWLSPSTAGSLESLPAEHAFRSLARSEPRRELSGKLLREVGKLNRRVALLESIMVHPDPALYRAIFGIESSRWRGGAGKRAQASLVRASQTVGLQLARLTIDGHKYTTLGGKVSQVSVFVHNPLSYPVRVRIAVKTSPYTSVTLNQPRAIRILAHSFSAPIKFTVQTSGTGPGTIKLTLTSPRGTPVPGSTLVMHVRPTDFGTIALIIFAAALAVFVIASAARAIRSKPDSRTPPDDSGPDGDPAEPGSDSAAARPSPQGSSNPHNRPEYLDSVSAERTAPTSAGAVSDQDPMAPGSRPSEEHR